MVTLGIDYGSNNIGVALVRQEGDENVLLFAGTVQVDQKVLKTLVEPRAAIRRVRRTRKTKDRRLRNLAESLDGIGITGETRDEIVRFCRRRGYKSLFDEGLDDVSENAEEEDGIVFRYSREEFFKALEKLFDRLLEPGSRESALKVCERVLNRNGDRSREVREIRIENRGRSRCAWKDCPCVTPRRDKVIREIILRQLYTVFIEAIESRGKSEPGLAGELERAAEGLSVIARRYVAAGGRMAEGADEDAWKLARTTERKALTKKAASILDGLKPFAKRTGKPDIDKEKWKSIRDNLLDVVRKPGGGRDRYCRAHSEEYVEYKLRGEAVPFRDSLTESEMTSRREEILFSKLWRYIEARVLPLAPDGVRRVVVERVAIDLLGGSAKKRQKTERNPGKLEAIYQQGPMYGFKDEKEMMSAEFGGLCAYCGTSTNTSVDRDHILPKAANMFDSYLNIVPSCPDCNQRLKGKRSLSESGLRIHPDAYAAYSKYVGKKDQPHLLHTMKKGVLNLLTRGKDDRALEGEEMLAIIARNFSEVVQTQRGPRPLARYLGGKLGEKQGYRPELRFGSGRHTAMYRKAAYPEFDKRMDKQSHGWINHALDAAVLGSHLPSAPFMEARRLREAEVEQWAEHVRERAPLAGPDGLPAVQVTPYAVPDFENTGGPGYVMLEMSRMNWNRKSSSTHRQDLFGWAAGSDFPVKRVAAAELAVDLSKAGTAGDVAKITGRVLHKNLRAALEGAAAGGNPGPDAASALIGWLRRSIANGMDGTEFGEHPADRRRREQLMEFASGRSDAIPVTIGVRMARPDFRGYCDIKRVDRKRPDYSAYLVADPANVGKFVCYMKGPEGQVLRERPLLLDLRQTGELRHGYSGRTLPPVPVGPLKGRAYGERPVADGEWRAALHAYLKGAGVAEYFFVRQGCVVGYADGSERFIVNFGNSKKYTFKPAYLKGVVSVRDNPLSGRRAGPVYIS